MICALTGLLLLVQVQGAATANRITPRDRFEWLIEAMNLYQAKKFPEAAKAFTEAVRNGDHTANTEYNLACCFALNGDGRKALSALEEALKAGYYQTAGLEADSDLASLHSDRSWPAVIERSKRNAREHVARMRNPDLVRINIDNLKRFCRDYESSRAQPNPDLACARQYLHDADDTLGFMIDRADSNTDVFTKMLDQRPNYFAYLVNHEADLSSQSGALHAALRHYKELYPAAVFPDVYVMVGAFNSGGTTNENGLLIGAEMFGKHPDTPMSELTDWQKRVLLPPSDFVPLVVHECTHYQQIRPAYRNLLISSLREGAADFTSYLVTGRLIERMRETHMWANAREKEIWTQFHQEMDNASTKGWLYGDNKPGWPDDVGYWMGFKICECYYGHSDDKAKALKDILTITDAKGFLEASGYAHKFD